jgi:D-arabinitol dehydrogenase (NADP+)
MRAVVYDAPGRFSVRELPDPVPGPGEVRLRCTVTGVCGTDLHIHRGEFLSGYPLVPGHELVGEVAEVGEGVTGLQAGQPVTADNTVLCGHCEFCRRDQPLYCRNFHSLGVTGPGGFAESVLVRAEKCFPLDGLAPEVAVMTEPTACVVHGMDVLALRPGSDVLVFGAGPTGLLLAQLLAHGGAARVTVAAPTAFKLELAAGYGADVTVRLDRRDPAAALPRLRSLAPSGFDVVVDATGALAVLRHCVALTRDGGTVLVYGMTGERDTLPIRPYEVFRRELTIKGSFAQTHCFDRAIALLRTGRVRTEGMVTHRFPLARYADALGALGDAACLKAVVLPQAAA